MRSYFTDVLLLSAALSLVLFPRGSVMGETFIFRPYLHDDVEEGVFPGLNRAPLVRETPLVADGQALFVIAYPEGDGMREAAVALSFRWRILPETATPSSFWALAMGRFLSSIREEAPFAGMAMESGPNLREGTSGMQKI